MKFIPTTFFAVASIATSSLFVSCENAATLTEKPDTETASNAIDLFNGKDLTGWKVQGGTGTYTVEDGCIVGNGENVKENTFLITEKRYTDFEFTYEFKFDHLQGNSGVMFRANLKKTRNGSDRVYGYQCEGDNKKRAWTAGLFDEARRKWLFPKKVVKDEQDLTDEDKKLLAFSQGFTDQGLKLFKWDDWNTIKVRCVGNSIKTYLNGELRVDFVDTDPEHDTREGFFGLQVHNGDACKVRWRNLKLVDLSKSE